jgi:dTDP-4-dehydrorhamnose 3,5-epimerase
MKVTETGISGLLVIEAEVFGDERGWFQEEFSAAKLAEFGFDDVIAQANHSYSRQGVLRGLHFQKSPHDQSKIVRCLRGRLFDVAVDIRPGSLTFGRWFGLELSEDNRKSLLIPRGFAHGFYSITDCELLYFCGNAPYHKPSEAGIRYDDPDLAIDWPLAGEPTVNARDMEFPLLREFALCES